MTRTRGILATLAVVLVATACTTTQASFKPGAEVFAARDKSHPIAVFEGDETPSLPYREIATLDVHLEATHFITFDLQDAIPKLIEQARAAGGDAIIEIKETRSRYLETFMYHVTAKAIRFSD
jgi:hypothetical protein